MNSSKHIMVETNQSKIKTGKTKMAHLKQLTVLVAASVVFGVSSPAWATWEFKLAAGETVGYIDDSTRWTGSGNKDSYFKQSGTILVTNNVTWSEYSMLYGSASPEAPAVIRVLSGGKLGTSVSGGGLQPGFHESKCRYGVLDVEPGGMIHQGACIIGDAGDGVATNAGTLKVTNPMTLGKSAGGTGIWVHQSTATNISENPVDLYVGVKGRGELIINGSEFYWRYYQKNQGYVIVGQSQEENRIVINEGGSLRAGYVFLGGREAGGVGRGELRLRGGTYNNYVDNGTAQDDLFWIGCGPDAAGSVDSLCYGAIRGWGVFTGNTSSQQGQRGVYARLGYGVIEGDGEGDESHILDCFNGICQVTNALPGIITESGWRAVNKGAVCLPGYTGGDGNDYSLTGCVGCDRALERPNLVNAIRMSASGLQGGQVKYFGVQVLAADRTDAHTNSLPAGANVLSAWRVGVFTSPSNRTTPSRVDAATIDFRYDQTKLKKTTTRIELLRYEEATGRWTRLNRINCEARPVDCIISTPTAVTKVDETYNLGTFAVIESEVKGLIIVVK